LGLRVGKGGQRLLAIFFKICISANNTNCRN